MRQGSVVFDSFALLSFLKDEPDSKQVMEYLLRVQNKEVNGYISAVNLCEVYYIIMREKGQESAEILATSLREWGLSIVPADEDIAKQAGQLKAQYLLSLADAFAATSQKFEAYLLTGDPEFQKLKGKIEIRWIG
jgi:ribonuclease VapC